jgi:hypothetical protein
MSTPYNIHSPGGQLITNQIVKKVPLHIQGRIFATHLIMLPTPNVDIILGMNWMKFHRILLDTLSHSVHINSPLYGSMTVSLMNHESMTRTVNHTEGKDLADIPVVCEYPDVFPDDLPGMPLDRNVEFAINCNRERHPFPEDLIGCHPMSWQS